MADDVRLFKNAPDPRVTLCLFFQVRQERELDLGRRFQPRPIDFDQAREPLVPNAGQSHGFSLAVFRFAFFSRQQAEESAFANLRETDQTQLHFLFPYPPIPPFPFLFSTPLPLTRERSVLFNRIRCWPVALPSRVGGQGRSRKGSA